MKETMKRNAKRTTPTAPEPDDILPEYDFSRGRRNKYAERYAGGTNVVVLDPDVAAVFPDAAAVNEALRALAGIIRRHRPARSRSRRRA
jgi:hypothetical protein